MPAPTPSCIPGRTAVFLGLLLSETMIGAADTSVERDLFGGDRVGAVRGTLSSLACVCGRSTRGVVAAVRAATIGTSRVVTNGAICANEVVRGRQVPIVVSSASSGVWYLNRLSPNPDPVLVVVGVAGTAVDRTVVVVGLSGSIGVLSLSFDGDPLGPQPRRLIAAQ